MTARPNDGEQRDALVAAVRTLFANGVMSSSGHGDASARLAADSMLLSVPGNLVGLDTGDLAVVDFEGDAREGAIDDLKKEIARLHGAIYKMRPDVGAVLHTHSAGLLTYAMANRELRCRYEAMRFGQPAPVPVVPWARRGTDAWIGGILEVLGHHPNTRSLLLGNHGVLVFGPDAAAAATLATVLEEAASAEIRALALGGAVPMPLEGT